MVDRNTRTTITKTTRLVVEVEEVERILRTTLNVPAGARLTFECGYDYLKEVIIEWTETEEVE